MQYTTTQGQKMTDEIKRMNIAEFREHGYLHEINRLVLHPLGLALEIVRGADGTERMGGVWDYRDDPEGMTFADSTLDPQKAENVCDVMMARRAARKERLGYVVQPIPRVRVLTTNYTDPDPPSVTPELEFEQ